ncbi:MAG: nucleotidyl transferase AbiEii/AbiGii toxin family protein [Chlorobi bacterium]|nr:nucleotidyl transferase AbiEii/AbiGii toxin family protein [Chlorobiota bacterium]
MLQYQAVEPATLGLLRKLQLKPYLDKFYLVGGTALAMHLGHRVSVDIDLFTLEDFNPDEILTYLSSDFNTIEPLIKTNNTLLAEVEGIRVDLIKFNYPFQRIIKEDDIRLLSLEDIAPMKLDAITGRGKKKDFYDLFYLLQRFTLSEMLDLHKQKYQHSTLFHVIKSLTWFADAEDDAEPLVLDKSITWQIVKSEISKAVNLL